MRFSTLLTLAALGSIFPVACTSGDGAKPGPDGGTTGAGGATGSGNGTSTGSGAGTGGSTGSGGGGPALGPTIGDFVGVNGFQDDPTDKLAAIGNVREYHDWSWCEGNGDAAYPGYPKNQNSFSLWGGFWDFDKFYADLQSKGVFASPAIQGTVSWLNAGKVPPTPANADTKDPASYAAHADHMFQYAARYGKVKVDDSLLKLASDQKRLSGLGTLRYIEDWNEQDAWWVLPNQAPLFSPAEYAAMASADYDGDQGKMGKTFGVKSADPSMKLVMGGLSGKGSTIADWEKNIEGYLDGIRTWAKDHRGGSFPADVINLHYYSFSPDPAKVPAKSPEDDKVEDTMKLLRAYRDANLPGKELWITEFGYDTDQGSNLRAPPLGKNSAEIVQGQWLVRYYLALLGAGFDRAFVFVLRDGCEGNNCHTQFDTCGLTTVKDKWVPKPSYFFLATVRARLAAYGFAGGVDAGDPKVRIMKFKDPKSDNGAYIVWAPTSNDTTVSGYDLSVGAASQATAVKLADQKMNGDEAPLSVASGKVKLDVSETPTIVLVDHL